MVNPRIEFKISCQFFKTDKESVIRGCRQLDRIVYYADLAKDIGDNLDKFLNKFISRNQWRTSMFVIVKITNN